MNHAIELQNVGAAYRDNRVLHDLNLTIAEGELVGVLGPNGAGKTTLFRVLTGLLAPASGTLAVFGRDLAHLRAAERARLIGVVPQALEVSVAFTVEELVMLGRTAALPRWSRPLAKDLQAVERALIYTDVAALRRRPITELSGGERQRVIVAMALAQEPRLLLLDEATSHLDLNHRLEIMQLVERLNCDQGVTALVISHDLNLAADFCRRLLLLDHGRLVADGPPAAVLRDDLLRQVYHCDVHAQPDPQTGRINVMPVRRPAAVQPGRGVRVHLVAGGGAGEELLRHLTLCGYTLTCGVLNQGDSDTQTATILGAALALEKPFSPIGAEALQRARELACEADALVLSDVPFGPGNVANLELLAEALDRGRPVLILAGIEQRDYTPGREAARRVRQLIDKGAVECRDIAELVARLPAAKAETREKEG